MSSIRPLVTITVLVVVGVVLYVKINEGTPRPMPNANESWGEPVDGVPPLATMSVAPTTGDGAAPAWPATPVAPPAPIAATEVAPAEVAPASGAPIASTAPATESAPAVPAVPALPEIASTPPVEVAATPTTPLPVSLPTNVPEARYPEQTPAADPASTNTTLGAAPAAEVPPIASEPATTAPAETAAPVSAQEAATTPEQMNAATVSGIPATPEPLNSNPLRPTAEVTPPDRYGIASTASPASTPATASSAPTTPVEQSFAESWPAIQAMLDRGELTEAHKALTKWYGEPSLTPTDAERVDSLLGQLAGTVVYSTEHRLAPAHVVKQGETLETIANEYKVPWQLLAKINGIAAADQVRPGQELKVVRGPFSAVVDLTRNQLTLMVDDRYAGRFPVTVVPGQTIYDGEWVVGKKSNEQAPGRALLLQGSATTPGAAPPLLVIASDSLPTGTADGTVIKIAANDAEELSDILSVGSRVVTRR